MPSVPTLEAHGTDLPSHADAAMSAWVETSSKGGLWGGHHARAGAIGRSLPTRDGRRTVQEFPRGGMSIGRCIGIVVALALGLGVMGALAPHVAQAEMAWGKADVRRIQVGEPFAGRVAVLPFESLFPRPGDGGEVDFLNGMRLLIIDELVRAASFVTSGTDERDLVRWVVEERRAGRRITPLSLPAMERTGPGTDLVVFGYLSRWGGRPPELHLYIYSGFSYALLDHAVLRLDAYDLTLVAQAAAQYILRPVNVLVRSRDITPLDPAVVAAFGRLFPFDCQGECELSVKDIDDFVEIDDDAWRRLIQGNEKRFSELRNRAKRSTRIKARLAELQGDYQGVEEAVEGGETAGRDAGEIYCTRLRAARKAQNFKLVERLLPQSPKLSPCVGLERARTLLAQGKRDDAEAAAKAAVAGGARPSEVAEALRILSPFPASKATLERELQNLRLSRLEAMGAVVVPGQVHAEKLLERLETDPASVRPLVKRVRPDALAPELAASLSARADAVFHKDDGDLELGLFVAALLARGGKADQAALALEKMGDRHADKLEWASALARFQLAQGKASAAAQTLLTVPPDPIEDAMVKEKAIERKHERVKEKIRKTLRREDRELLLLAMREQPSDDLTQVVREAVLAEAMPSLKPAIELLSGLESGKALRGADLAEAELRLQTVGLWRRDLARYPLFTQYSAGVTRILGGPEDRWGVGRAARFLPRFVLLSGEPARVDSVLFVNLVELESRRQTKLTSPHSPRDPGAIVRKIEEAIRSRYEVVNDEDQRLAQLILNQADPEKGITQVVREALESAGGSGPQAVVVVDMSVEPISDGEQVHLTYRTDFYHVRDNRVVRVINSGTLKFFEYFAFKSWLALFPLLLFGVFLGVGLYWWRADVQESDPRSYAILLEKRGELVKAAKVMADAGFLEEANRLAAQAALEQGHFADAIEHFLAGNNPEQALLVFEKAPNKDERLCRLGGDIYYGMGRLAEALKWYKQANQPMMEAKVYERMGDARKAGLIRAGHQLNLQNIPAAVAEFLRVGAYIEAADALYEHEEYLKAAVLYAYDQNNDGLEKCFKKMGSRVGTTKLRAVNLKEHFKLDFDPPPPARR